MKINELTKNCKIIENIIEEVYFHIYNGGLYFRTIEEKFIYNNYENHNENNSHFSLEITMNNFGSEISIRISLDNLNIIPNIINILNNTKEYMKNINILSNNINMDDGRITYSNGLRIKR